MNTPKDAGTYIGIADNYIISDLCNMLGRIIEPYGVRVDSLDSEMKLSRGKRYFIITLILRDCVEASSDGKVYPIYQTMPEEFFLGFCKDITWRKI